jgi:hypothetical protein
MSRPAARLATLAVRSARLMSCCAGILSLLAGTGADAQSATPAGDAAVHRLALDGARLHASRRIYRFVLTDTSVRSLGEMESRVAESQHGGVSAWVITRIGAQGVNAVSESLFVSRSAVRPLHWSAIQGRARLAAEFVGDSIFGAMTSPLGKQNIVLRNRGDVLVGTGAVDALLEVVPLQLGWADSATVLVVDPGGSVTIPATVSVVGEERLVLLSGDFDCWVVQLETERGVERLWVNKRDQMVVRSEQPLPQLGGAMLDRVLVRTDTTSQS